MTVALVSTRLAWDEEQRSDTGEPSKRPGCPARLRRPSRVKP